MIEPSDAERAAWPDATRAYVEDLEALVGVREVVVKLALRPGCATLTVKQRESNATPAEESSARLPELTAELRARANARHTSEGPSPTALLCARAANRIEALEAENFKLAAGVCEHRLGNEHGNAYCGQTGKLL